MKDSENEGFFCDRAKKESVYSSDFTFVVRDNKFPVTKHHTLIVTHRHVSDFFDLNSDELNDLANVLKKQRQLLLGLDKEITGFNIGVNVGVDAGQSIMHCHIHLIPRRKGDMDNPKGGVRGVIPSKQKYIK